MALSTGCLRASRCRMSHDGFGAKRIGRAGRQRVPSRGFIPGLRLGQQKNEKPRREVEPRRSLLPEMSLGGSNQATTDHVSHVSGKIESMFL
jgi:hypothetical protein